MSHTRLAWPLAITALVSACTSTAEVEELAFEECDAATPWDHATIPTSESDAAAPLAPTPEADEPEPTPGRPDAYAGPPRLRLEPRGSEGEPWCHHNVIAEGFPAMRDDGLAYVNVHHGQNSGADFDREFVVEHRGVVDDALIESIEIYQGEALYEMTEADAEHGCARARARIARAIRPVNQSLHTGWRPLRVVPVQLEPPPSWSRDPLVPSANLHERPAEVFYRNGYFIARVAGVRVLQRLVKTDWLGEDPEMTMNAFWPTIMALYHDAETGFAVADLSYESSSCMSDPTIHAKPIALAPEVVIEAERRAAFARNWADIQAEQD